MQQKLFFITQNELKRVSGDMLYVRLFNDCLIQNNSFFYINLNQLLFFYFFFKDKLKQLRIIRNFYSFIFLIE